MAGILPGLYSFLFTFFFFMKRSLLVLSMLFYCFLSIGQPGGGDPGEYDPCLDPDITQPEYCFLSEDDGTQAPLDKGVPFLITVAVFFGLRYLNSNK